MMIKLWTARIPMAAPQQVAGVVGFQASGGASFIDGEQIGIDDGPASII